jgi:hypothetical protein
MSIEITITNESESIKLFKGSKFDTFQLTNTEGQIIWLTEKELMELKYMITDIIQHVHKNDYDG